MKLNRQIYFKIYKDMSELWSLHIKCTKNTRQLANMSPYMRDLIHKSFIALCTFLARLELASAHKAYSFIKGLSMIRACIGAHRPKMQHISTMSLIYPQQNHDLA